MVRFPWKLIPNIYVTGSDNIRITISEGRVSIEMFVFFALLSRNRLYVINIFQFSPCGEQAGEHDEKGTDHCIVYTPAVIMMIRPQQ